MSFISENVIPGNHGTVFETNAKEERDLKRIQEEVLKIEDVKDFQINTSVYPVEVTIHTYGAVKIKDIQDVFVHHGSHAIAKSLFAL